MAFTGNFMCTSFKQELLTGTHNFTLTTGDVFKIAMYTNTASFTAATTDYTVTNEVTGTNYVAGYPLAYNFRLRALDPVCCSSAFKMIMKILF
jgi:hypothetical protein